MGVENTSGLQLQVLRYICLNDVNLHEKKLVTAIETRWNPEYLKEKRLFENREPLMLSLSQLKSNIFRSSEE